MQDCSISSMSTKDTLHFCTEPSILLFSVNSCDFSALLALCVGNPPVTGGFSLQMASNACFDVSISKLLNQQSSCQGFETPCPSCYGIVMHILYCCSIGSGVIKLLLQYQWSNPEDSFRPHVNETAKKYCIVTITIIHSINNKLQCHHKQTFQRMYKHTRKMKGRN